ncbi:hypothetical protein GOODEAATRI_004222, partial [Goodea atripinnis]
LDAGVRGVGSGAVSVNLPGLVENSMAAGKGAGKPVSLWDNMRIRFIVCFLGVFDHMRARFQTSANHMMLNINMWSTLILGLVVLWTGEVWSFLSFAERHPSIFYNILLFGLTSALGQVG